MKIILIDKILKLGNVGFKTTVKLGYARNQLIPKGKSLYNINTSNYIVKKVNKNIFDVKIKENKIKKKLFINFYINYNNNGNLFSTINCKKIINIIKNYNIKINKNNISIIKPIKVINKDIIKIKINNNYYKFIILKINNYKAAFMRSF
ncbi:hypothetical protein MEJ61_00500 [Enterobacteriaceae bacterium ET-AT1-13]|nr:hypothetical protein MEJ61_00500 [Enterobacteriaceae bacterium ET-AT1-13]WGS66503.1 hypothetical protein MEJ63_00505 [Enterobacteriaceae bacterium Cmel17]WMC17527.1 MAG: 50S ribosomal L9 C-terminal domain-containing protein [Enterobacteriaceae bacterium Cmel21]WMC17734.1 MAG: hypothetical protein NW931_00500 [Enterobacteriaceae bacterium PSmelAO3-2]WMC17938.1 MAG: hypothetical protein NW932_00500 [Enterobacteriaceae bacterium PSmelAO3-1]WMC18140.1 MAG: hypothetical protein NW935_00500 [Ente